MFVTTNVTELNGEEISFKLSQLLLESVTQVRNLGVILDADLTFQSHISSIIKIGFYHLRNIKKIRSFLSQSDAEKLVHAFISSRLNYSNALLTGIPQKHLHRLQLLQNAAARVLMRKKPVLRCLHWLPVKFWIDFKILALVFKALHGLAPQYLSDMLLLYEPGRPLRSTGTGRLVTPRVSTKIGEAAFSSYAPRLWKSLPSHIKCAPTFLSFKSKLKTFLFSHAFQ